MNHSDKLSGHKILITGASGFIGSHLRQRLCRGDAEVYCVSRELSNRDLDGANWLQGDLTNITTVREIFRSVKPELIFHLAGTVSAARNLELVVPTFQNISETTVNLLTVAAERGCQRFLLPASFEEPDSNRLSVVPSSPYAAARWASSIYTRMFYTLYRMPAVIARIFLTYGPGEKNEDKLIPYVISCLLRKQAPKLTWGEREVDWVFIEDIVDGLIATALASDVEGSTIDLGSGTLVSIRGVAEQLTRIVGTKVEVIFGALPERPMEQVRVADIKYTHEKIGWKPAISLEEGLKRTVEWYRSRLT